MLCLLTSCQTAKKKNRLDYKIAKTHFWLGLSFNWLFLELLQGFPVSLSQDAPAQAGVVTVLFCFWCGLDSSSQDEVTVLLPPLSAHKSGLSPAPSEVSPKRPHAHVLRQHSKADWKISSVTEETISTGPQSGERRLDKRAANVDGSHGNAASLKQPARPDIEEEENWI